MQAGGSDWAVRLFVSCPEDCGGLSLLTVALTAEL
ncbi:hypothetical protein ACVWZX_001767 [Deinococcus sp. UYEF24]